jgi:hypothetical protein
MRRWPRLVGWTVAVALLLAALVPLALWLALEPASRVAAPKAVAAADVERALNLFKRHDPQRQRPGVVRLLAIDQHDAKLVLNHLGGRWAGLVADLSVQQSRATLHASLPLPQLARWLNVELELAQAQGLPEVTRLRVGRLPLPAWSAMPLLGWAIEARGRDVDLKLVRDVVRHVDLRPNRMLVFYAWQEDTSSRMLSALVPSEDQLRLKSYSDRLVESIAAEPAGTTVSLARLLPPMFALARQRSAGGGDAAQENRAALLTLTFYANRQGLAVIVPAAQKWKRAAVRTITLAGRSDTPLHYLISATLAAESGSPLADAVGLYKEVADAQGGSGFSFNDLAADRAGTRLGERAVRDAVRLQTQLAGGIDEGALLPKLADLPEGLSAQQFAQRFGTVGSAAYQRMVADIESRLDTLPLLR